MCVFGLPMLTNVGRYLFGAAMQPPKLDNSMQFFTVAFSNITITTYI
jgi:hypothetical protein